MLGPEPEFSGPATRVDLMIAFNYYSYLHNISDTKTWILEWMMDNGYTTNDKMWYNRASLTEQTQTMASAARMLSRGLENDNIEHRLKSHIDYAIDVTKAEKAKPVEIVKAPVDNFNQVIADADDVLDSFYHSDYKRVQEFEVARDAKITHIKGAHTLFVELLEYVKSANSGLTAADAKRYVKQLELIVSKLAVAGATAKRRAPTKSKTSLKYLAHHEDYSSIDGAAIPKSNILWCYNVKNRKLTKLVAPTGKKLDVRGTTVTGFDEKKSWQVTLRKPTDILPTIVSGTKRDVEKITKTIKTKKMPANGRINAETLLLKAFK